MNKKVRMFKVIALSVGGRGNKIWESGQVISENHLPANTADALVKSKHISEIDPIEETESNFVPTEPEIIQNNIQEEEHEEESSEEPEIEVEVETISHEVTEEDLKNNPELSTQGVKVGDIIQIAKKEEEHEEAAHESTENKIKIFIDKNGISREVKSMDDITKPELIFALNKENASFSATANKSDLYTLWINSK